MYLHTFSIVDRLIDEPQAWKLWICLLEGMAEGKHFSRTAAYD